MEWPSYGDRPRFKAEELKRECEISELIVRELTQGRPSERSQGEKTVFLRLV